MMTKRGEIQSNQETIIFWRKKDGREPVSEEEKGSENQNSLEEKSKGDNFLETGSEFPDEIGSTKKNQIAKMSFTLANISLNPFFRSL